MDIATNLTGVQSDLIPANPVVLAATPAQEPNGCAAVKPFERQNVLRAAVDLASPEQILAHLVHCVKTRQGCAVVGISAPYATAMADDASLREAFLNADLLIPDGKGFTWGARMLGVPCSGRIAIPDLCEQLLAIGSENNSAAWKVFIYGGTEAINQAACANLRQRFPGLAAVDGQHGYNQGLLEENALIKRLKDESFNLVIVARPSPDKERFLTRCCHDAGIVGVAAGGYADILAGKTRRAPASIQAFGMEWLYRVIQEPRRLWKRVGWANARFAAAVTWKHLRMREVRPWWGCPAIQVLLLALVLCAAYHGSLNAPYHFDDPEYIEHNPTIRSFAALSEIKVLAFRKLWWFSNAVCYWLSEHYGNHQVERPDVRIFRGWNIACHFIAVLALYGLVRRVLKASGKLVDAGEHGALPALSVPRQLIGSASPYDLAAVIAAAIFAAHPLCTESVTYVSGRDNGQGGMFYLLGLWAAAVAFQRMGLVADPVGTDRAEDVVSPSPRLPAWPGWFWPLIAMTVFGGCAALTKESYLTFPFAVVLLYTFFYRGAKRRTVSLGMLLGLLLGLGALAWGAAGRHEGHLGIAIPWVVFSAVLGAMLGAPSHVPAVFPVLRAPGGGWRSFFQARISMVWAFLSTGAGLGMVSIIAVPYAYERTIGALTGYQNSDYVRSICSQAYAVPWILLRTVIPFNLNIDHDFPSISDPYDTRVLIGGAIILALIAFGLVGMFRAWLGSFGVLLALLSIAPTNTVIERGDIVSERNFYIAAAGGALLLAWLAALIPSWLGTTMARRAIRANAAGSSHGNAWRHYMREAGLWTAVVGCCPAMLFSSLTVLRNNEWNDPYVLWRSAWVHSPAKLRVLYNLGVAANARKQYAEAEMAFSNAMKIGEDKAQKGLFRPDEGVQVKCFHLSYANIAGLMLRTSHELSETQSYNKIHEVDTIFSTGMERTAFDPDLALSYAQFLLQLGRTSDAAPLLQKSLDSHVWAEQLYYPLGLSYLDNANFVLADKYLSLAVRVQDRHTLGVLLDVPVEQQAEIFALLGVAKIYLKQPNEARNALRESLDLEPQGTFMMLLGCAKARNPKLKPVQTNPPDLLVIALSQTRWDLIQVLIQSIDDHIKLEKKSDKKTLTQMLRGVLTAELQRRADIQRKREAMGFMDDPDRD